MPVSGLDQPCGACGRPSGDHTLREWAACVGTTTTDLPYEALPSDMAKAAADAVRERFQIEPGVIVADNVVVRAATLDGSTGPVGIRLPVLLHDFQIGVAGSPPVPIATVAFIGDVDSVRGYGRLVRDSANAAVKAAQEGR